jgi:peptidoglycan/LPS O-acetylase OafA/YrhL
MIEREPLGSRKNTFDFLRFFFASLVIFSHSYPLATGTEDAEPLRVATAGQLTFGSLAVDCFFIISGFLISQSWTNQPSIRSFLEKRVRRIYPGFIAATLIGAFVISPLFSIHGGAGIDLEFVLKYLARTARLLPTTPGTAFETNPARDIVNGSLWSISYEFWCYVGVVFCGVVGLLAKPRRMLMLLVAAIAIAFTFAYLHLSPGGKWLGVIFGYPPFWARLLPYFLVGMTFFAYRHSIVLTHRGAAVCVAMLTIAAFAPNGMIFVLPWAAAYLIFWFAYLPLPRLQRFGKHGDISYGIYLYAFPVQQMLMFRLGSRLDEYTLFLLAWAMSIAAGAASWWVIERPWVMGRRRSMPPRLGSETSAPRSG